MRRFLVLYVDEPTRITPDGRLEEDEATTFIVEGTLFSDGRCAYVDLGTGSAGMMTWENEARLVQHVTFSPMSRRTARFLWVDEEAG